MLLGIGLIAVGLAFVLAAWDVFRRALVDHKHCRVLEERLVAVNQRLDKQHEQMQAVMGKINAVGAAQTTRVTRIGAR
jgi:hypothetical protein